ncbi:MAG: DUF3795 domain-containing protein [Candidatus Bathyarchaeia archaeon]
MIENRESDYSYGVCGVFCEQCPTGNGRIKELARELKRLTADFISTFPDFKGFNFSEFTKGLDYFLQSYGCPTCLNVEEPWCEVLKCEKAKELKNCLLCGEYLECPRTEYHRDRYPFVLKHYQRVKEVGLLEHFKEERERAKKGLLLNDIRKY